MAANLKQYIKNPRQAIGKKIVKIRAKWKRRVGVTREFIAGNYTSQEISMDWAGKPLRMDMIQQLINRHHYRTYLEIGCRDDECFGKIRIDKKIGVDPTSGGTLRMTSDEFFAQNKEKFDIIFIDGLHEYRQVKKDIINSINALNNNGVIIMHDCLPLSCLAQYDFPVIDAWNGDVWKAFIEARTMLNIDAATCLIDHGVGIIKPRKNSNPLSLQVEDYKKLNYAFLVKDYQRLLNLMDYNQALAFAA